MSERTSDGTHPEFRWTDDEARVHARRQGEEGGGADVPSPGQLDKWDRDKHREWWEGQWLRPQEPGLIRPLFDPVTLIAGGFAATGGITARAGNTLLRGARNLTFDKAPEWIDREKE